MAIVLCPECGTARTGSFRFCRSCSFDFDSPGASALSAATPVGGVLASAGEGAGAASVAAPIETSSLLPDDEPAWTTVPAPAPGPGPVADPGPVAAPDPVSPPTSDVVVVKKRTLRRLAGLLGGGLVGAMLAGAVVIPFLGEALVQVGALAGVATIVASAFIGLRIADRPAKT